MPLLQLENVSKKFGQVVVGNEISFQLNAGATIGIIGPNGAGKSSLFGMISGDIRPDSGSMKFDGRDLLSVSPSQRARLGIGRTYQVPRPFENMTVFENVLVAAQQAGAARGTAAYEMAYDALKRSGLAQFADQPASTLTLLRRKRLELARAVASKPKVLLLDEIAGGLTDAEVNELIEVIKGFSADGITIVWIEHVVRALLSTVDRLLCLAAGEVVADGDPREVLASEEVRAVYLGGKIVTGEKE